MAMTRDDIARIAREAKFVVVNTPPKTDVYWQNFEKFVDLVAAAEREACAVSAFNAKTYLEAAAAIRARGLTSLQRQLIDAGALESNPAGLKRMNREAEKNGEEL